MDDSDKIRQLEALYSANERSISEAADRACTEADRVYRDATRKESSGKYRVGPPKVKKHPPVDGPKDTKASR